MNQPFLPLLLLVAIDLDQRNDLVGSVSRSPTRARRDGSALLSSSLRRFRLISSHRCSCILYCRSSFSLIVSTRTHICITLIVCPGLVWSGLVLSRRKHSARFKIYYQIQQYRRQRVSLSWQNGRVRPSPSVLEGKRFFSRRSALAPSSGADYCLLYSTGTSTTVIIMSRIVAHEPRTGPQGNLVTTTDRPNLRLGHVLFNPCTLAPPRCCARPDLLPIYHGWLSFIAHTGTVGAVLCDKLWPAVITLQANHLIITAVTFLDRQLPICSVLLTFGNWF